MHIISISHLVSTLAFLQYFGLLQGFTLHIKSSRALRNSCEWPSSGTPHRTPRETATVVACAWNSWINYYQQLADSLKHACLGEPGAILPWIFAILVPLLRKTWATAAPVVSLPRWAKFPLTIGFVHRRAINRIVAFDFSNLNRKRLRKLISSIQIFTFSHSAFRMKFARFLCEIKQLCSVFAR